MDLVLLVRTILAKTIPGMLLVTIGILFDKNRQFLSLKTSTVMSKLPKPLGLLINPISTLIGPAVESRCVVATPLETHRLVTVVEAHTLVASKPVCTLQIDCGVNYADYGRVTWK